MTDRDDHHWHVKLSDPWPHLDQYFMVLAETEHEARFIAEKLLSYHGAIGVTIESVTWNMAE